MKVASFQLSVAERQRITGAAEVLRLIEARCQRAADEDVDLLALPGFIGCWYQELAQAAADYLGELQRISRGAGFYLCSGIYYSSCETSTRHAASLLHDGCIILEQRQLYLARWERAQQLGRGRAVEVVPLNDSFTAGMVINTDVFYPQVARALVLKGANLLLCPVGFVEPENLCRQLAGVWNLVQQNQVFAVESGFKVEVAGTSLWGSTIIYAPLDLTADDSGFLVCADNRSGWVVAELEEAKRQQVLRHYDVLSQLNPELYQQQGLFGRYKPCGSER